MKKWLFASLLTLAAPAFAAPTISWTWSAPTTGAPAQAYNFYQASGSCGTSGLTYAKLVSGTTVTNWTQPTVPSGVTCSYITAVSAVGVEGPPSPTFQFDATAPGAPGSPKGTYNP
jgi:hypothetical protein